MNEHSGTCIFTKLSTIRRSISIEFRETWVPPCKGRGEQGIARSKLLRTMQIINRLFTVYFILLYSSLRLLYKRIRVLSTSKCRARFVHFDPTQEAGCDGLPNFSLLICPGCSVHRPLCRSGATENDQKFE